MKIKTLRGVIEIRSKDDVITVIASDETLDRHGDVLPIDQWDLTKFMRSPRMLIDHNHEVASIVGKWENIRIEGKKLLMDAKFHNITEASRNVSEMVKTGYLDTVSVGFIYHSPEGDGQRPSFELIETSWVTVPANPSARIQASLKAVLEKATDDAQKEKVKEFLGDEALDDEPIIPEADESDDIEPDGETPELDEAGVNSVEEFVQFKTDKAQETKVLCTVSFIEKLVLDSEQLKTLTQKLEAMVGAEKRAKILQASLKEAAGHISHALRDLKKSV